MDKRSTEFAGMDEHASLLVTVNPLSEAETIFLVGWQILGVVVAVGVVAGVVIVGVLGGTKIVVVVVVIVGILIFPWLG